MATQEAVRINDPSRLMAARKATAPANTFKSRVLTQGSHRLKAAEPSTFLSGAAVSSNLYPLMTGDQKQLMQAYAVAPGGSPAPCDQKQINGSLHGAVFTVPEKDEKNLKEKDLKSAKKCKEGSGNEIVGDSRLRNTGDVASPSGSTGIKDSVAETAHANQDSSAKFYKRKYFSAKRQRLDSTPLHAAVAQSGETLNDHGVNTYMLLRDSETNTVETKKLGSTLSRHGVKSIITKVSEQVAYVIVSKQFYQFSFDRLLQYEKLEEKKERKKKSKRESAARAKLRKQEEIESLREIAEKLKRENSKLKNKILQISEECQEVGEENDSLMDEVAGRYGADAISDIRARNPASANQESHGDGERTLSDNNSTDDRNGETDQ